MTSYDKIYWIFDKIEVTVQGRVRIDREPSNLIASLSRFASSLPYQTSYTLNTDLYMQTTNIEASQHCAALHCTLQGGGGIT